MDLKLNARERQVLLYYELKNMKNIMHKLLLGTVKVEIALMERLNKQELKSMMTLHKSLSPLYFALFANGPVHFKVTEGNSLMVPKLLVMTHAFVNGNIYLNPNDLANHMID